MATATAKVAGLTSTVALNNGLHLPVLGLGVYQTTGAEAKSAVLSALKLGYRHIDSAQGYENETEVGQAVKQSGVPRDQVWVTTKVLPSLWAVESTAYAHVQDAIKLSLDRLGFDYIDLMLLHAPGAPDGRAAAWKALEDAHKQGQIRAIGVSNFGIAHLEKLASTATVWPAVNQIELHPWLQWKELVKYCQSKNIVLEAYSPLARPYRQAETGTKAKLEDPRLVELAQQVGRTPAQVLIRWSLQKGFVPLPKSVKPERQRENADVFGWQLTEQQMAEMESWDEDYVSGWDPIRTHEV